MQHAREVSGNASPNSCFDARLPDKLRDVGRGDDPCQVEQHGSSAKHLMRSHRPARPSTTRSRPRPPTMTGRPPDGDILQRLQTTPDAQAPQITRARTAEMQEELKSRDRTKWDPGEP